MIDVHVLTHAGTRADWLEQCLGSLAGQPCTAHVVDNAGRSFSEGRALGYSLGSTPYVSFVDSDDWVAPGAIQAVLDGLRTAQAVCTMETAMLDGQPFFGSLRGGHHLFATHRELVTPLLGVLSGLGHAADRALFAKLRPRQLSFAGYFWRLHNDQHHRLIDGRAFRNTLETVTWPN